MLPVVGIVALLTVLGLSLLVTRIATTALTLTGLSREAARFQARSAFTGTGFTTGEAEKVVRHPVRRQVIAVLMVTRSAGLVTIVISLILSLTSGAEMVTAAAAMADGRQAPGMTAGARIQASGQRQTMPHHRGNRHFPHHRRIRPRAPVGMASTGRLTPFSLRIAAMISLGASTSTRCHSRRRFSEKN